jgi:hypothetical protein
MNKITVVLWSDGYSAEVVKEHLEEEPDLCVISATEKEVEDFYLDSDWTTRTNEMLCGGDYRTAPPKDREPDDPPPDTERNDV